MSPPAVLRSPPPVPSGDFIFFCQTILLVVGSMAVSVPDRGDPAGRTKPSPPPDFLNRCVASSKTSCLAVKTEYRMLPGTYTRLFFGLKVIGAQAFPPDTPGKMRIGLSQ